MTSPTVLSHRVIYLLLRTMRMPPNSMTLLVLAEVPIYVSNVKRTKFLELGQSVTSPSTLRKVGQSMPSVCAVFKLKTAARPNKDSE